MKKRLLSGILALTMCFSMTPSIAWGSGMTEFSDGASGEAEKKEKFTDEPEIEEEKEQPVAAAGVPEVGIVFEIYCARIIDTKRM